MTNRKSEINVGADARIEIQRVSHLSTTINKAYKCGVPGCQESFAVHDELLQHGVSAHKLKSPLMLTDIGIINSK